ncbi:MAG: hypothetical protein M1833_005309 [Piccolia ochrophora]|nr:MAG: hypothetical protein M1833_005309 [Piccolia ochrophora]
MAENASTTSPSPARPARRRTLEGMFTDLNIGPTAARTRENFTRVLSGSFRRSGWPNWKSSLSRATTTSPKALAFTIRMDPSYRTIADTDDPAKLFEKASAYLLDIRQMLESSSDDTNEVLEGALNQQMAGVVFGSNLIERVGLGLDETMKICEAIFRGEDVDPNDVDERSDAYQKALKAMVTSKSNIDKTHIIRSRREVIQHARALQHITTAIAVEDQLLTEKLILETHKMLCTDIDIEGGASARAYAGKYRTVPVRAGSCGFVPPSFVPAKMKAFIEEFNNDIATAEGTEEMDPFALAAKYCQEFVQIHPFLDGNGRTCRLILNAILLKYAGILVPIGEHDDARAEYLGIARRAGEEMEGSGELATLVLRGSTGKLRALKQKLRGKSKAKAR